MVCKNCGNNNSPDARFCAKCGADLNQQYAQQNQAFNQNQAYEQAQFNQAPQGQYMPPQGQYTPVAPQQAPAGPGKGLAIPAMICGILSIVIFCLYYLSIPLGVVGIVLGGIAKSKGYRGGMATAGIVCGAVGAGLALLFVIIAIAAVGAADLSYFYY